MLTQEQVELDHAVRRIMTDIEATVQASHAWTGAPAAIDRTAWRRLAAMGLIGLGVSGSHGGGGAGAQEWALVAERCGAALTSCPVVPAAAAAATLAAASIPASEQWLAAALEGSRVLMPAWETLPAAVVPRRRDTSLIFWDGVVDGVLHAVPFGHEADGLIAFTDRYVLGGPLILLIDLSHRGVTRRTDGRSLDVLEPTCEIRLEGVPVSEGSAAAFPAPLVQLLIAAELVGVGSAALDSTVTYAKQRFQFGRAIGSFQAVKHSLADRFAELDAARMLVSHAAAEIDSHSPGAELATRTALCAASAAALRAANDGIQFHGGTGFTWEHTAHLYLKHAQSRQLILGSGDDQLHALADLIFT